MGLKEIFFYNTRGCRSHHFEQSIDAANFDFSPLRANTWLCFPLFHSNRIFPDYLPLAQMINYCCSSLFMHLLVISLGASGISIPTVVTHTVSRCTSQTSFSFTELLPGPNFKTERPPSVTIFQEVFSPIILPI